MQKQTNTLLLLMLLGFAPSVSALELTPFPVRNLSPPALVHGLPIAETPRLLPAGKFSISAGFDLANNATDSFHDDEAIMLDGETYVATLGLRYGITEQLQLGVDIPWVWHADGFLDGFIEDWHDFFGLPNGDRNDQGKNHLNYIYVRGADERLRLDENSDDIGDVRLLLAWQFKKTRQSAFSLQAQAKAPTGDAEELTGSEAWDLSLAVSAQYDFPLGKGKGAYWGGAGVSWLGDGDVIEDDVEDYALNGWLGIGWSPLDWLALKLQLDSHSPLYDSKLVELGDATVILTMGAAFALGEKTTLDFAISEDPAVNTAPDVTFHLALQHRF